VADVQGAVGVGQGSGDGVAADLLHGSGSSVREGTEGRLAGGGPQKSRASSYLRHGSATMTRFPDPTAEVRIFNPH
jgi:hypothetical protein